MIKGLDEERRNNFTGQKQEKTKKREREGEATRTERLRISSVENGILAGNKITTKKKKIIKS